MLSPMVHCRPLLRPTAAPNLHAGTSELYSAGRSPCPESWEFEGYDDQDDVPSAVMVA